MPEAQIAQDSWAALVHQHPYQESHLGYTALFRISVITSFI